MAFSIAPYKHIILDMNGTFMFGYDEFGDNQNYYETYIKRGHNRLSKPEVEQLLDKVYSYMSIRYLDESYYDRFPSVEQAILKVTENTKYAEYKAEIEDVFEEHELGTIDAEHQEALRYLSQQKPISILSNLWSKKAKWLSYLKKINALELFTHCEFSSEGPFMKPHPLFFEGLLNKLALKPSEVLFIGDSYRCDINGAYEVGIDSIWLSRENEVRNKGTKHLLVFKNLISFVESIK